MSVMRDYRPRPEKKKKISSEGFVDWGVLIAMGMSLGFLFGYGLLYT